MPTTVHIPDELLAALDRRAAELGTSRNRLIVRAVEESLQRRSSWPPSFLDRFKAVAPEHAKAVDDVLEATVTRRKSKGPVEL